MLHQSITNERQNVLSYPVDLVDQEKAIHLIEQAWNHGQGMHVITINAEMIITAQNNSHLDRIIRRSDLVIADGAGVILALKLNGHHINRLPGIELAQYVLAQAATKSIPVSLIGGTTDTLNILYRTLPETYPGLKLVACHDGYFETQKEESIIKGISASGAALVLVAMGIPRQEYFIEHARKESNAVFIGIGGSFDIWSGAKNRAPAVLRNCHLEWLYRLICEPWRFQRMSAALPNFAWQIMVEFLKQRISQ